MSDARGHNTDIEAIPKRYRLRMAEARTLFWSFVGALAVSGFILGYTGFAIYYAESDLPYRPLDFLYRSIQLFTLSSGDVAPPIPWQLELARIFAPTATATAIFRLVFTFARAQRNALRLFFVSDHFIIAGFGRRGGELFTECVERKVRVVVIDDTLGPAEMAQLQAAGAMTVAGHAQDVESLRKARAHRAARMAVVCGSDGVNMEIALRVHDLASNKRDPSQRPLGCHVQITDYGMTVLFREHSPFESARDRVEIVPFNSYENSARQLFAKHPLDWRHIDADSPLRACLFVMGMGRLGESVAIQAAKIAHFANGKRLRIVVYDYYAESLGRGFRGRHPGFEEFCDIEFRTGSLEGADTHGRIREIVESGDYICTAAFCLDQDALNLKFALSLRANLEGLDFPIHARINEESGLATLLRSQPGRNIHAFGGLKDACSWEALIGEPVDRLARQIHENALAGLPDAAPDDAHADCPKEPWHMLDPAARDSHRQKADHLPVKLRALGLPVATLSDGASLKELAIDESQVETLARMEHARRSAEHKLRRVRRIEGNHGHGRAAPPTFEELTEAEKESMRKAAREIPGLLNTM